MVALRQAKKRKSSVPKGNILGAAVALASVSAVAGVVGLSWPGEKPRPLPVMVDFLFDATTRQTSDQMSVIRTSVMARIRSLHHGDTVCLHMLRPDENGPLTEPLFCGAIPLKGRQVSSLTDNPRMRDHAYGAFLGSIERALKVVAEVKKDSDRSPIVEAIWHLGQIDSGGKARELEIWSDMVNKSTIVDHFRPPYDYRNLKVSFAKNVGSLKGARVQIHQLVLNKKFQTNALADWWKGYWKLTGMTVVSHELIQQ